MRAVYRLVILAKYRLAMAFILGFIRIVSNVNKPLRKFVEARATVNYPSSPLTRRVVWMHCSSLGEFEQGRPILEAIRKGYPDFWVVLTFFSPSGYLQRRHYDQVDVVTYLPYDTPPAVKHFLDRIRPDMVIWVKYDFWFAHWKEIHRRSIPLFLIAARFRIDQWLFRAWAFPFLEIIAQAERIDVQDQASADILEQRGLKQVHLSGDPRVDRVMVLPGTAFDNAWISAFAQDTAVFIAGSVWEEDLLLLKEAIERNVLPNWKWIIVPHDLDTQRLDRIEQFLSKGIVRYSRTDQVDPKSCSILLLDTIGMLNLIYRFGSAIYIGGGFGKSVHNLLEPAVYGLPVLFGPRHHKFPEAKLLIEAGGGFEVEDALIFCEKLDELGRQDFREKAGKASAIAIRNLAGATGRIMQGMAFALASSK